MGGVKDLIMATRKGDPIARKRLAELHKLIGKELKSSGKKQKSMKGKKIGGKKIDAVSKDLDREAQEVRRRMAVVEVERARQAQMEQKRREREVAIDRMKQLTAKSRALQAEIQRLRAELAEQR